MPGGVVDDDEDSTSTTSTLSSEQQSEYEVEEVFAEKRYPDGMRYLVKWANYPMHRCSWEPEECFNTPDTLLEWCQKKKDIREGKTAPFDYVAWQNQQDAREQARIDRRRRRAEKRSRIQARAQKKISRIAAPSQTPRSRMGATPQIIDRHGHATAPRTSPPLARLEKKASPEKPPPILFGNGTKKEASLLRLKEPSNDNRPAKHFNLSTRWRYEKAKTDEPAPDVSQLELFRPSEWLSRPPVSATTTRPTQGPSKKDRLSESSEKNDDNVSTAHAQDSPLFVNAVKEVSVENPSRTENPGESSKKIDSNASVANVSTSGSPVKTTKAGPSENEKLGESSNQSSRPFPHTVNAGHDEGLSKTEVPGELSEKTDGDVSTTQAQNRRTSLTASSASTYTPSDPSTMRPLQHQTNRIPGHWADRPGSMPEGEPILPRRVPAPGCKRTYNGRFFNPGEVLVFLYYGPEKTPIGAARLCGISQATKSRVLISKSDRAASEHSMEVWFRHLCTLEDYKRLCLGTTNQNWCTGWIEGFNDTELNILRIAQDLGQRNLIAVSIPSNSYQNVLLAYPPDSRDFGFLQSNYSGRGNFSLFLTARSQLGPIDRLDGRKVHQAFAPMNARPSITGSVNENTYTTNSQREAPHDHNAIVSGTPALPLAHERKTNEPAAMHTEKYETQGPTTGNPARLPSSDQIPRHDSEPMDLDPPTLPSMAPTRPVAGLSHEQRAPTDQDMTGFDLSVWFERQYGVTFSTLLDSKQMAGFYVMYPGQSADTDVQADAQCDLLMAFLQKHTTQTYSSRQSKDWGTFTLMEPGVALFHENFVDFNTLPSMANLLHKNITFWSFSLRVPHEDAGHAAYFHRIFPRGTIFLLTEDVMLQKPEKTAAFLAWFRDTMKKRPFKDWRLMMRPGVLDWALRQFDNLNSRKRGIWIVIHHMIMELGVSADVDPELDAKENFVLSPNIPGYTFPTDSQHPGTAGDLTKEQKRADRLTEFFAGWALVNRSQFRKFHIICGIEPFARWRTWQHVVIDQLYQHTGSAFKIDFMHYWSKLQSRKAGSSTEEKYSNTPQAFTPQTPRASSYRSEQALATTCTTEKYPQPYL